MHPEASPSRRPAQFSLWHLFVLLLVLSIMLALGTQLRHVGAVAALYLAGASIGLWRGKWRLAAASATALAVFVLTYLACWLQLGYEHTMQTGISIRTDMELQRLGKVLNYYANSNGKFPESLADAAKWEGELGWPDDVNITDRWGNDYDYRKTPTGFELASLGRDGVRGGVGLDADTFLRPEHALPPPAHPLPLWQFLFDTQASGVVFAVAAVASLVAAAIWYGVQRPERPAPSRLVRSIAATTVLAALVAVFLAIFHVAVSQMSGGH